MSKDATSQAAKGPGGRPELAEAERRCKKADIRLTIAEDTELKLAAKAAGISVAAYVRRRALGHPITVRQSKTDARLVHEVNMVGVNLMQYLRDDRFGRGHRNKADWDQLYDRVSGVLDRLVEELDA